MLQMFKFLVIMAMGLTLLSCIHTTKPNPEPPLYAELTYQDADWVLYITTLQSREAPLQREQHVMMKWMGLPYGEYPAVVPTLFIDGEGVEMLPENFDFPSTLIGSFSKPANSVVDVMLKDIDTQIVYLNTSIRLVEPVSDFSTALPYNYQIDNSFSWQVERNSPHQLFEAHSPSKSVYKYIPSEAREYVLSRETSLELSASSSFFCIIRQINFKLKNRVAIYSSSFESITARKGAKVSEFPLKVPPIHKLGS